MSVPAPVVCDESGLAVFDLIRRHGALANAVHCAFDLLELNGEDLRRQPIEERKWRLANLLDGSSSTLCKLGCEGIVSKRLGSPYRSGRSPELSP